MDKLTRTPALVIALCIAAIVLLIWQVRRATTPPPTLGLKDMPANIRDDTTPPRPGYVPVGAPRRGPAMRPPSAP
jgi:hypothetical protein